MGVGGRTGAEGADRWETDRRTDSRTTPETRPQNEVARTDSLQAGAPPRNGADSLLGGPPQTLKDSTLEGSSASPTKVALFWKVGGFRVGEACCHSSADSPLPARGPRLPPSAPSPEEGPAPDGHRGDRHLFHTQQAVTHGEGGCAGKWHPCPRCPEPCISPRLYARLTLELPLLTPQGGPSNCPLPPLCCKRHPRFHGFTFCSFSDRWSTVSLKIFPGKFQK